MTMSDLLNNYTLGFEKPVRALENQIKELEEASQKPGIDISSEISTLKKKVDKMVKEIYNNLSPWDRVHLARHPNRPHSVEYIKELLTDFHEVNGDRKFANDPAIIAGFGFLDDQKVAVIAVEKGRKTVEKIKHNFGMPRPEGYRKAIRVMKIASRFKIPIISLVDTPGAYPGIGAEERGQACAIAENLQEMFDIESPIISVIIGEGGSGGALGIAIADKVLMMEYSVYSVISPESCASILWADPSHAEDAANALKLDPSKALELKVIDSVIQEPAGGAHRHQKEAIRLVKKKLIESIIEVSKISHEKLIESRYNKFRNMGNETISR